MITSLLLAALLQDPDLLPPPRPAELMQAARCLAEPGDGVREDPIGPQLRPIATVPSCLAAVFAELGAAARTIVGDEAATILLSVKVGRAFSQASLLHGSPGDPVIRYVTDLDPIPAMLGQEWDLYVSPDGDLGWSGFLLVMEGGETRVRSIDAPSLASFYDETVRLEAEFFPGKTLAADARP